MPLEHLTAVPALVERVRGRVSSAGVIVAPDLGAAKLAERYAEGLQLPVAIVHKRRISRASPRYGITAVTPARPRRAGMHQRRSTGPPAVAECLC